jgi:psp operon transcriptional activator
MVQTRNHEDALGQAPAFLEFQQALRMAAKIDRPVIIIGERGSGKELAAGRLHYLSNRWQSPLITLNCASLTPSLIETELFGHEAGSFTGATRRRKGRFEEAHGGTLFLDEIGLIPREVQEKILRVVEYGTFERVGGSEPIEVDVRIIGATNADLPALSREGRFKEDLLDRLSFEVLFLPPLRYRREDIPLLVHHFAGRMAREAGLPGEVDFSPEVMETLLSHPWPGNIRELKNTVERAVYRSGGGLIETVVLDPFQNPYDPRSKASAPLPPLPGPPADPASLQAETSEVIPPASGNALINRPLDSSELEEFTEARTRLEKKYVAEALRVCGGNKKAAAQRLRLSYDQFRGLCRRLDQEESTT